METLTEPPSALPCEDVAGAELSNTEACCADLPAGVCLPAGNDVWGLFSVLATRGRLPAPSRGHFASKGRQVQPCGQPQRGLASCQNHRVSPGLEV